MMVAPVFRARSRITGAVSTPPRCRPSIIKSPKMSLPALPINPTGVPSIERLCAVIAEELPMVKRMSSASFSCSYTGIGTFQSTRSMFNSPTTTTPALEDIIFIFPKLTVD